MDFIINLWKESLKKKCVEKLCSTVLINLFEVLTIHSIHIFPQSIITDVNQSPALSPFPAKTSTESERERNRERESEEGRHRERERSGRD